MATSSPAKRRVLLVPRLGGRADTDWYPWLMSQLGAQAISVLAAPDPDRPDVRVWPDRVAAAIGDDPRVAVETVLIGHSVGCLAVLHALSRLPFGVTVRGAVFVAGFWTLARPDEALQVWQDAPLDVGKAAGASRRREVLLGTDDPFAPELATNRRLWEARLAAHVTVVPGAGHFARPWEPAVLEVVRGLL